MPGREWLKRTLPTELRSAIIDVRSSLAPPPLEEIVLHGYDTGADPSDRRRLTLIIPSVSPDKAFGGVVTTLDVFLQVGRRCGADLRVILDDFENRADTSVLMKCAQRAGVDGAAIEVAQRTTAEPRLLLRRNEVFFTHNWWTTLNLQSLLDRQSELFGVRRPFIYLIQDYEPGFYPFSSTHMASRSAYATEHPCWGVFNSGELHAYFSLQGHATERAFVFEPRLTDALRPFLALGPVAKQKRILVYGRPSIERNCYPAVKRGLRKWAAEYPAAAEWEVVSAGLPHPPTKLSPQLTLASLGKLPLADYAGLLRTTAIGLSLMASPHPSYPPLEMAHFGVRTITNSYTCKDLSTSHANIVSLSNIDAASIAGALSDGL